MSEQNNVHGVNRIGNNENRFSGNKFGEHDDRGENDGNKIVHRMKNIRRVSFKPSGAREPEGRQFNHKLQKNSNLEIRARLGDYDDMVDFRSNGLSRDGKYHGHPYRRCRSPVPRNHGNLIRGALDWFLVTIPHGQKYDKEYVLKELQTLVAPESLIPYYVKVESSALSFYVDDLEIAKILLNGDRRITLPDGFKLIVHVRSSMPQVRIDANFKEKMKLAMAKRYTSATKALDLKKFHADVDLKDIFCGLFRPSIMMAAIDIIAKNIPDLEALDLSDNNIHLLGHMKCLAKKLPSLKILHMANNKIMHPSSLHALRECQLVDLVLKGNPLRDRLLREETVYIREIRKRFPKLLRLDFDNVPPLMGFDISDEINMPSAKPAHLCNDSAADIVRQFLEQYFIIFDSDNRQPLLDAYHEHAMFSLNAVHSSQPGQRLVSNLPHSRNIQRIQDYETSDRHLKNGRVPVVSFLSELPATQHDLNSFAVDLSLFTPKLMQLTVTGVFRERSQPTIIRSFQRSFVIVPSGSGFCIKNEMLHINNATMVPIETTFKTHAQSQSNPAPTPSVAAPPPLISATSSIDDATKLQLIQLMATGSNMNLAWSEKCLIETNWDYQRAVLAFTVLNNQQKIPAEAFAK